MIFVYVIFAEVFEFDHLNSEQIDHICGLLDDFEDFRWSHLKGHIKGKNFRLNRQHDRM